MPKQIAVLIAEDELLIRMAAAAVLRDEGFDVIEAEHAEDALDILAAQAPNLHVLFTDIHMPGSMDGLGLAHHTARAWPWIALLITSGRARPEPASLPAGSRFLTKPYCHHHVVSHVRALTGA